MQTGAFALYFQASAATTTRSARSIIAWARARFVDVVVLVAVDSIHRADREDGEVGTELADELVGLLTDGRGDVGADGPAGEIDFVLGAVRSACGRFRVHW